MQREIEFLARKKQIDNQFKLMEQASNHGCGLEITPDKMTEELVLPIPNDEL